MWLCKYVTLRVCVEKQGDELQEQAKHMCADKTTFLGKDD